MEQNYYIPVSGKELRDSELYITLALIVAGGFYKNKAYVTVKSEYAKDSLKNAFNQNGFELSGFDLSFQGESSSGQHFFQNQREQENFLRMAEVYSAFSNSESFLSPEIENISAQVNSSVNIVA